MIDDASLPPNAPMTNGTGRHGEADASSSHPTSGLAAVCADFNCRVSAFLSRNPENDVVRRTQEQTRIAIGVIETALDEFGFEGLSLSYNGGKDCLVLLVLYLSTLHAHFRASPSSFASRSSSSSSSASPIPAFPTSIPSIYAKPPDPFPAVTTFVESSSRAYHLSLVHISTTPAIHYHPSAKPSSPVSPPSPSSLSPKRVTFRDAFEIYLAAYPSVRAIFVGTRRTDPHGAHLTHFDRTDKGWPDFMRVHPVIDWHLSEIWCFLRADELKESNSGDHLAYCIMYDQGYTSLGGVGDTLRNPKLMVLDSAGAETYRPAHELTADGEERLGRE